ncbi:hypothetical protein Adt_49379 [Abeliophyllum distichum]|uniref:Secreted protein n=1 Tax=Abeliophyllum distichum TaxID=126358 RepID=A0ABD1NNE3_9LAMI
MGDPLGSPRVAPLFIFFFVFQPSLHLFCSTSSPRAQQNSSPHPILLPSRSNPRGPREDRPGTFGGRDAVPAGRNYQKSPAMAQRIANRTPKKGPRVVNDTGHSVGPVEAFSVHMLWAAWLQPDPKLLTFKP